MTSFRQIEANRRNACLSTGPVTDEGKRRSRQNAIRHGLTAETVIDGLEDAGDYAAFEMAVTADFDAQSAIERELVLRLASLLWRLRRATTIESGLFKIQAESLPRLRRRRDCYRKRQNISDFMDRTATDTKDEISWDCKARTNETPAPTAKPPHQLDNLTRSFAGLTHSPACLLDKLSRYEVRLWRQASQILLTLQCLDRRKSWRPPRRSQGRFP
jgi:hypothetical protein